MAEFPGGTLIITCPVCSDPIPCATGSVTLPSGISVTIDHTPVYEHCDMHERCICRYVADGRMTDPECMEHTYE